MSRLSFEHYATICPMATNFLATEEFSTMADKTQFEDCPLLEMHEKAERLPAYAYTFTSTTWPLPKK